MNFKNAFTFGSQFPAFGFWLGRNMASIGAVDRTAGARSTASLFGARNGTLVKVLNDALRDELAGVLRYMGHGVIARKLATSREADRFQRYASEKSIHARRLTERILQLGGEANGASEWIAWRSAVVLDDATDLPEMIRSSLGAEGASIDIYCRILGLVRGLDMPTQQMVEEIMIEELHIAEELWEWRADQSALWD